MWRVAIMVLALLDTGCMAVAAEPLEDPTNILAAQLRDQGYECNRPKSAERDVQASKPDEEVWIVQCENAKYRMRRMPRPGHGRQGGAHQLAPRSARVPVVYFDVQSSRLAV